MAGYDVRFTSTVAGDLMGKRISREDKLRLWWEKSFQDREDLLRERFGETAPPGSVIAFSWNDPALIIPGACALCFKPRTPERTHWLTLSHGLTQPLEPEPPVQGRWSGYGCEFGVLTNGRSPWAAEALYQLMTYWKSEEATIGIGHRVPVAFFDRTSEGAIHPELGVVAHEDPVAPLGSMRAMMFWTYLYQPKPLWTTTGYFDILVGTTITAREWEMAKETSSAHVLYLLVRAGIGQVSDTERPSTTDDPRWSDEWKSIRRLSEEEVQRRLTAEIGYLGEPPTF